MTKEDRQAFSIALTRTAEVFGEALSVGRMQAYFEALGDLDSESVQAALRLVERTARFFPKPAEIREAIEGAPSDRALAAWTRVEAAREAIGPYQSVDFGDPILHATVRQLGGWPEVAGWGRLDLKEAGFKRKEFLDTYALFLRRGCGQAAHLPGLHETSNALGSGGWTRGLDHRGEVLQLDERGQEIQARRPLGALRARPALAAGPPGGLGAPSSAVALPGAPTGHPGAGGESTAEA